MLVATPPVELLADAPRIVQPAPYQASFGRIVATVPSGTEYVVLLVNGRRVALKTTRGKRVSLQTALPRSDSTLRLVAVDGRGKRRASAPVGHVLGLPPPAAPRVTGSVEDATLARRIRALVRRFPATAGVYVQDLVTGRGAAWNARARFPAASTLKLAIAVEALRSLRGPPGRGSRVDELLRAMLIRSDNRAANALEVVFGGSTSGGSARVNATMRALGLVDSEMYGGYEVEETARARPIPVGVVSQPSIARTKYSTASDLARLARAVHLAAGGRGPLLRRVAGFTPAEARYLLYLLAHVGDRGKLGRFLGRDVTVAHKAGWIPTARHDNGLLYWPGGAAVVAVMTWSPGGAGTAADVLAGRIAQAAHARFR